MIPETKVKTFSVSETRTRNTYGVDKEAKIVFEEDVAAEMRDGIRLMTNVFRPANPGKYPAILSLAPYGKHSYPPDQQFERIPNVGPLPFSEYTGWEMPDPVYWVPNGYIVVGADCRATNQSEGEHFAHFDPQISQDFHDLVEWIAEQEWCDGNVGSNGVSYLAATQWLGASENPPHLKAAIPWEGFNDFYREHVTHGGMPDTNFYREIWGRRMNSQTGFIAQGATAEDSVAEQNNRPLMDDFWQAKHPDLSNIETAIFAVASWATAGLHTRGSIEGFKQASSENKWLYGHGRKEWETYYAREGLEMQKRFFDCFLKGQENGMRETPRVRIEVRDYFYDGRERYFDDFPIPETDYRPLYLDAANNSLNSAPVDDQAQSRYAAQKTGSEADSTTWEYIFDEAVDLIGHMKLKLWVSAEDANDLDLHVAVKKFDTHGNEVYFPDFQHIENGLAASGWLRVSHRELDEEKSTPWQPWLKHERLLKLAPDDIVPCEVEILASATGFRAGDKLQLIVQGYDIISVFNRFKHEDTVNAGHHVIYTGGDYDSHLLVPAVAV
ncbi:MAG: CocE/NonD family hydrolase [Alphaproteobacteria bacterium]|jgi:putative CocE/NonD family hydrolase